MDFCIPKKYTEALHQAFDEGKISVADLLQMDSLDRRAVFKTWFEGDEQLARLVNAEFESKLVFKNWQSGIVSWIMKMKGLTEPVRQDMLAKVMSVKHILSQQEEQFFLRDLARSRLGIEVNSQEANEIIAATRDVMLKKEAWLTEQKTINTADLTKSNGVGAPQSMIDYGLAYQNLAQKINDMKPNSTSFGDKLIQVLSFPKSAQTSALHMSAPFVQGWGSMATKEWWQGWGQMIKYMANEKYFNEANAYILAHPDYKLLLDAKVALTNLGDKFSNREEAIQSSLLEQFNQTLKNNYGVPNIIKANSRAFTGYLNFVRANGFYNAVAAARAMGEDVQVGSKTVQDLGQVMNVFSGRGPLGKFEGSQEALNLAFYAPRKMTATIQMFNPLFYGKLSPFARQQAFKRLIGTVAMTSTILAVARASGANVDLNPTSQAFMKIDIGGEKFDITGGNAIYARLWARLLTGKEITSSGKEILLNDGSYNGQTKAEVVANFMRGKLSPVASTLVDYLWGKDAVGRPFDLSSAKGIGDAAYERLTPIGLKSELDYWNHNPDDTAALLPSIMALFGVSMESPLPPMDKFGLTQWGTPEESYDFTKDQTYLKLRQLGVNGNTLFPPSSINGVKLNDDQYKEYIVNAGKMTKSLLDKTLANPAFDSATKPRQLYLIQQAVKLGRDMAAGPLKIKALGGDNDIIQQSMDKRLINLGVNKGNQ